MTKDEGLEKQMKKKKDEKHLMRMKSYSDKLVREYIFGEICLLASLQTCTLSVKPQMPHAALLSCTTSERDTLYSVK